MPRQFSNQDNSDAHYLSTGPEIWWQLRFRSLKPDALVAGVGTGGTVMGTGRYLREKYPSIKIHPLEPSNSPTLSTGHKVGRHRIQGIGPGFKPDVLDLSLIDEFVFVSSDEAFEMSRRLAKEEGITCGISSGAAVAASVKVASRTESEGKVIVTVLPDSGERYLSTTLYS